MKRPIPDEVILGLLKAEPMHGYELLTRFRSNEHLGRIWTMSTSQLYAVLKRLEDDGAIIGKEFTVDGAPPRIVYAVTEIGEQKLFTWLSDPLPSTSIHRIRVMFLSRLYIAEILRMPIDEIFANQNSVCERQRDKLLKERNIIDSQIEMLTLDFVIGQLNAALVWLNNCEIELSKSKKDQTIV